VQPIFDAIAWLFSTFFFGPVYNVMMLLYHLTSNFALSIVLLTLLIRVCLIPLTRKQLQSSRKMQELQPQIKALQAQYRGDPQGLMAAQRQLFKENNYSQMQGCLPLLIQMPVLYALFGAFRTVITLQPQYHTLGLLQQINNSIYSFLPKVVAASSSHPIHTQFLWTDLALPDPLHILPLLAAALTFIQLRMAMPVRPKRAPGQAADTTAQATQFTMYLMPLVTFLFGLNFPSGMALYWCVGTLFMAVQQYFLAGVGSLWVGVPGMERFVPEPKQPLAPVAAPGRGGARPGTYSAVGSSRALVSSSAATSARSPAATAATAPSSSPTGGGFFARLREQMATAQRQAQEAAAARANAANGKVVEGSVSTRDDTAEKSSTLARAEETPNAARAPRPRPSRQAPQLVKPTHTPQKSALSGSSLARSGNEHANGTNGTSGTDVESPSDAAPKPAPAAASSGARRAVNGNGAASGNGTKRAAAGSAANTRPPNAGQRKGSGAKGASPARPRSGSGNAGRSKGGR
jgi:YidC/Oxa1 family membrane protein insertase